MTREEHIIYAKNLRTALKMTNSFSVETMESLDAAIKALEQQPCGDCISRQATVEFLEKHAETYEDVRVKMGFKASASLINNRNNLPPITPTQNWIPTSERQPEENGNYLAFYRSSDGTAALEFVMVDHCNAGGGWLHERRHIKKVIAWMPLPEPYKEG